MSKPKRDHAHVIAPPPLIFAAAFLPGWYFDSSFGFPELPETVRHSVAYGMLAAGALLGISALYVMRKARTAIEPWGESTAIVTSGPFRYTRNPLYLTLTLVYIAAALLLDSPLAIATLPAALGTIHFGVIRREERYLERKFGATYMNYKQRVRRWI